MMSQPIQTSGGAVFQDAIEADVVVGRDQINHLIQTIERLTINQHVSQQQLTQVFMLGPVVKDATLTWYTNRKGMTKRPITQALNMSLPETEVRQLTAFEAAQAESQTVPLTPDAAYSLGLMAAYRRNYETAVRYFKQLPLTAERFDDACEHIAWLQQSRAMMYIRRRDYIAASALLTDAEQALARIAQPAAKAVTLRGYIAKTLAQIADAQQEPTQRDAFYAAAKEGFEQAIALDPGDAGAYNGLGNVAYATGNLDLAIDAYQQAIELAPQYTAAYNDLGLAYEGKLITDPDNRAMWLDKALVAFRQTMELAKVDPGFPADYPATISAHMHRLRLTIGEALPHPSE